MNNVYLTEAFQKLNKMSRMSDSKSLKESRSRKRRLKESSDKLWYGIPGIKFIWINSTADPLIEYKGQKINSYIVEDTMWDRFLEDGGLDQDFDAFGDYMRDHADEVYELCEIATNPNYYGESYKRRLKESIKRILRRMNEAQMSPEDEADSAMLRQIYAKLQKRRNAKLTPEEKKVMNKYGLEKPNKYSPFVTPEVRVDNGYKALRAPLLRGDDGDNIDKINLADKARKRRGRVGSRTAPDATTRSELRYARMKHALWNRDDASRELDDLDTDNEYGSRGSWSTQVGPPTADYMASQMGWIRDGRNRRRNYNNAILQNANDEIDSLLRRKEESYRRRLKESAYSDEMKGFLLSKLEDEGYAKLARIYSNYYFETFPGESNVKTAYVDKNMKRVIINRNASSDEILDVLKRF